MQRNLLHQYISKASIILYAILLLVQLGFTFLIGWSVIQDAEIAVLSIGYHLLTVQFELFLFSIIFYFYFFKKVLLGQKEYYLFPALILLNDVIFNCLVLYSPIHIIGVVVKVFSGILFLYQWWTAGNNKPIDQKMIGCTVGWGLGLFICAFIQSLLQKFSLPWINIGLYLIPLAITAAQIVWILRRKTSAKQLFIFWSGSVCVWAMVSPWASLLLYKPITLIFDVSADYINEKMLPFFIFQIIHTAMMATVWCSKAFKEWLTVRK